MLAGFLAAACSESPIIDYDPLPTLDGRIRLVSYSSCDDMLAGLRQATAKNVTAWGIGPNYPMALRQDVASAKQQATPDHSTTNVHEAGVDEPDLVKTDGKRVITVNQGVLRVVDAATRKVTGTLRLVPKDQSWAPADLLITGDRALVLFQGGGIVPFGATAKMRPGLDGPKYLLIDLSGEPKVLGSMTAHGAHVDARQVGSTVRIVIRSVPEIAFPEQRSNATESEMRQRNRETVMGAPIDAWLPRFEIESGGVGRTEKVRCDQVSHPDEYTGTSMLTVHTIDLAGSLGAVDPISVAADGDTVYGTQSSLYVTSNPHWWFPMPMIDDAISADTATTSPSADTGLPTPTPDPSGTAVAPKAEPSTSPAEIAPKVEPSTSPAELVSPTPEPTPTVPPERTEVHRFDITGTGAPRYVSSGAVSGRLLNQYSLSEFQGNLRVATTTGAQVFGDARDKSESGVYVLNADTLSQVGSVTGLGKGERIYSVRFIGGLGYVVTFRQVDPLYALDLRNPTAPKVTGELKITGYSAYLHPGGEGRLIGIGQEASQKGRTLGTQISLFDVNDPANPRILSRFHQPKSGSESEWDPHAFLYWPKSGLAVLPLTSYDDDWADGSSALVLNVSGSGITKVGVIKHPRSTQKGEFAPADPGIRRSVVIGDSVWTVSDLGLKVNDATTLADQAWIPFG